jgi:hypothetical protein
MEVEETIRGEINKPTFVSGGVQGDRIRNIIGHHLPAYTTGKTQAPTGGVFYITDSSSIENLPAGTGSGSRRLLFDPSRVVPVGPDNAGSNIAARYWRLVSL